MLEDGGFARVDLYWLPLGAGDAGHCVRGNGRIFEGIMARRQHRPVCDLYHSALEVWLNGDRFVIEMAPVWGNQQPDRGVVSEGPVGLPWLGRSRFFRYEVRRWRNGAIPDIGEAAELPRHLDTDVARAQRLLDLVPLFPAVTWGRDELHAGEMWNSNSLTAWLLAHSGHHPESIAMPPRGRAPGWSAGLTVTKLQDTSVARGSRFAQKATGARNGSQRVQASPDPTRPTQSVCAGNGLPVRRAR